VILVGPAARRNLAAAIIILFLFIIISSIRPVKIVRDRDGSFIVWLWAWQECRVKFINSVTHHPVDMSFKAPWSFSGFSAKTDPGTEEYYTSGSYAWNDRLGKEHTRSLNYCSEVGIDIILGGRFFHEAGGCITLTLLWPPGFQ